MQYIQDPATNPFTRENWGAPPAAQGGMGLYLPQRGVTTALYIPSRWERFKILGWAPFDLAIPSTNNGLWQLVGNDAQQFSSPTPVYFCAVGFKQWSNQPEGAQLSLFDENSQQALINPSGPDLLTANFGGTGKRPYFFKKLLFLDPGDELLATITNLSANPQIGQIVVTGLQPILPGDLGNPV